MYEKTFNRGKDTIQKNNPTYKFDFDFMDYSKMHGYDYIIGICTVCGKRRKAMWDAWRKPFSCKHYTTTTTTTTTKKPKTIKPKVSDIKKAFNDYAKRVLSLDPKQITIGPLVHNSNGETRIRAILDAANIPYEIEKTFPTGYYHDTGWHFRFDFFVDKYLLIEYQGSIHYKDFTMSKYDLNNVKLRDHLKAKWATDNNLVLHYVKHKSLSSIQKELANIFEQLA